MTDPRGQSAQLDAQLDGSVLWLRFNRPERKNALTLAMYAAAADAIAKAQKDPAVRVLVLEGREGCFCAGNDLADFMQAPALTEEHPVIDFMRALQTFAKPVVASVRGPAVGIGTTVLLHCDLVYASDNAYFQLPFVNLGLCPEFAASYLLPRSLGHVKASELILLGEGFDAQTALALQLVNEVLPDADLDVRVRERLARLAAQPPAALRRSKALLKQSQQAGIAAAMNAEVAAFTEGLASEECAEAIEAFFAKRAPDFSRFQ
ncbi:enoyl-CoA hydratase [Marinimicrobium sp. ABcell2]|uniref:enoyl-CoA hydratase n=1 Tax=Marinimicrobium sp. ABcell2 TaxID=3069751 RepID=UPI0027B401F5|nr:enoyl-CoA hydratase [Marinimicrobium sp. ABcell2]MDQ2078444.1 enoyl-CoA hydratase [Marinimicrobium sp. ABcell2]